MRLQVFLQLAVVGKSRTTLLTNVVLFARVNAHVSLQRTVRDKSRATLLAHVVSFASMNTYVCLEVTVVREVSITNVAHVSPLWSSVSPRAQQRLRIVLAYFSIRHVMNFLEMLLQLSALRKSGRAYMTDEICRTCVHALVTVQATRMCKLCTTFFASVRLQTGVTSHVDF